jgi:hypothetical protein
MEFNFDELRSRGVHKKHAVTTWILGGREKKEMGK